MGEIRIRTGTRGLEDKDWFVMQTLYMVTEELSRDLQLPIGFNYDSGHKTNEFVWFCVVGINVKWGCGFSNFGSASPCDFTLKIVKDNNLVFAGVRGDTLKPVGSLLEGKVFSGEWVKKLIMASLFCVVSRLAESHKGISSFLKERVGELEKFKDFVI